MPRESQLEYRIESDSLGEVRVPRDRFWGPQTERSRNNFRIGSQRMPLEIIRAYAVVKKAAAFANRKCGALSQEHAGLIARVCEEIEAGKLDEHFPLCVWQTGSGTQTNMNLNEVIANRAHLLKGGQLTDRQKTLHPNDHVNRSQSSNDTFPTAMNIAAFRLVTEATQVSLQHLRDTLFHKAETHKHLVKIGRTHTMDATPITLGQELSGYVSQLDHGADALRQAADHLLELAIGGTAVGTGLNAPAGFESLAVQKIAELTGYPFRSAPNKFEAQAAHDSFVRVSSALRLLCVSLLKMSNDLRFLASGPRAGLGELLLPVNEPGSSIMPGKVNPTQIEALSMVCAQVMGNDVAIGVGGMQGHFQLNAFRPLLAYNLLMSAQLLADACRSFNDHCAQGIEPNSKVIARHLEDSLMLVTALSPHIGYDKAAQVAKLAHDEDSSLKQAAVKLKFVTEEQFDAWVVPEDMVKPAGKKPET